MDRLSFADHVVNFVRSIPPVSVAIASFTEWFQNFPVSLALQWVSLIWVAVQIYFFLKDRRAKRVC